MVIFLPFIVIVPVLAVFDVFSVALIVTSPAELPLEVLVNQVLLASTTTVHGQFEAVTDATFTAFAAALLGKSKVLADKVTGHSTFMDMNDESLQNFAVQGQRKL